MHRALIVCSVLLLIGTRSWAQTGPVLGNALAQLTTQAAAEKGGLASPSDQDPQAPPPKPDHPHWSNLPIWGAEAAARGHRLPLPFGAGATFYDARQPVTIKDLKLAIDGSEPVSISGFAQVEEVDSKQRNTGVRFDVWLLPFLNVYGVAGHTTGSIDGVVIVTSVPAVGRSAQDLSLNAEFDGPTVGGGLTLAGGFAVTDWHNLQTFFMADVNRTMTFLSFANQALIAGTSPVATVFSTRIGLLGDVGQGARASIWAGAMHQRIQEVVAGRVAGGSIEFIVTQFATYPWNALAGGQVEIGRHFSFLAEAGIGRRTSVLVGGTFRF